ncbi:acetyl-CoA C-acyltransferase family protein [Zavarzinia compransoris]|uniref:Acetyl-CoA C-acyltransferase n=1 Tax=Zavarzinia compransoris TaxID=1264899 RepID=A0A317E4F9_9PROT|nr:acetyl-CoA C-acyltransferase family protein [Zavarzinia compransoris]PWR21879.1 acetyl-CoA C-acyltransferase [Zavarzinia compransoris]TDP45315.1 acetyl-CoA acetyltransferase /3-ketoacyl-CoA thiolase [Zavarzinia compransoris]
MVNPVYVVAGVRTAIGTFGGALKDKSPGELGTAVTVEALKRAGVAPAEVGHVVFGQVIQTEPADMYLARVAGIKAGIPVETPAFTLNRLCGSGVQAVISAAQGIALGDYEIAVAGGAEVMTRAPHQVSGARFGTKMGDTPLRDMLSGALTDPFNNILMGITAENVAERHGIDRAAQDALALESHRRAARAVAEGYFKDQILPVEVKVKGKPAVFDTDEHFRTDAKAEDFTGLRPVFRKDGTVTAGNASGINDGAAAVVLAGEDAVKRQGLKPLARLVGYAHAGVEPTLMGIGPVPATRAALARAGLSVGDLDIIESNEAFAAQACAVTKELGLDPAKVNPNGSGIALGHPVGATGVINTIKTIYELHRTGGRYGLVTMCIGGGQGIAAIFERV